jgi:hypothetical protein
MREQGLSSSLMEANRSRYRPSFEGAFALVSANRSTPAQQVAYVGGANFLLPDPLPVRPNARRYASQQIYPGRQRAEAPSSLLYAIFEISREPGATAPPRAMKLTVVSQRLRSHVGTTCPLDTTTDGAARCCTVQHLSRATIRPIL